tara:strand:- start:102 stop:308 length:207 start_codon:yes stop_codon:yes gene_type:complete
MYVDVESSSIHLVQFLKVCMAVQSGGMAKHIIEEGQVMVNGEVCYQKKKSLIQGDVIHYKIDYCVRYI